MKKIFVLAACAAAVVMTGCTATKSVVTEFDKDGKVVKTTETSESVVKNLTDSTKGKTVVAWESGWAAYMSCSTATTEDPTPTFKMFAGKTDKGLVSALPGQQNWDGIAEAINATKYDLTVSKDGIGSTGTAKAAETVKTSEAVTETAKTETAAGQTAEKGAAIEK